jgi:ribosome recycling factor
MTVSELAKQIDLELKNNKDRENDFKKKQIEYNAASDELAKSKEKLQDLRAQMIESLNEFSNSSESDRIRVS